jgi:hypothetical protein
LTILPFSLQMVDKTRLIVTVDAGNTFVVGSFPRFDVDFHVVTNATEKWLFRYLIGGSTYDDKAEQSERQKDRHTCGVPLCPFF